MKCVNPKDSSGTDLGIIVHLRVEGIADNFANTVVITTNYVLKKTIITVVLLHYSLYSN